MRIPIRVAVALALAVSPVPSTAADLDADPATIEARLSALAPGDTLHLAPGTYGPVAIAGVNGSESAWTTIEGPALGEAVFEADPCCNTIEIRDSSFVAVRRITLDGKDNGASFGVSAKDGAVHHVVVDGCTFLNHGGQVEQQQVAISTKLPTWGWVIRANRILDAGTGMYLGNSDGSDPFVGGLIEGNYVFGPMGYCIEIKWQAARPTNVPGMPLEPQRTIIRDNVFVKTDQASLSGDRPNVLVGGFPGTGTGSLDRYEIYGNLFAHNPREALLQASGRVSVHDNVFVDSEVAAVVLRDHDLPLRQAYVYNNTVYGVPLGLSGSPEQGSAAVGNLVFAAEPIRGTFADRRANIEESETNAGAWVLSPSRTLGGMDFYPKPGKCTGAALDLSAFSGDADWDRDFNGVSKGTFAYRGAYAGEGSNPGWKLENGPKNPTPRPPAPDGGTSDSGFGAGDAGAADGQPADAGGGRDGVDVDAGAAAGGDGCGCGRGGSRLTALAALLALGAAGVRDRRSRRTARDR